VEYIKCPYNNVCDKGTECALFCPTPICKCEFEKQTGCCPVLWAGREPHMMAKKFKEKLYESI